MFASSFLDGEGVIMITSGTAWRFGTWEILPATKGGNVEEAVVGFKVVTSGCGFLPAG